jgi:hypothetical protein
LIFHKMETICFVTVHNRNRFSKCPPSAWTYTSHWRRIEPLTETSCLGTMSAAATSVQLIRSLQSRTSVA